MRKALAILILGGLLVMMALPAGAEEETPWFDMVNCEFCKHLMDNPALLDHTVWEHHNISNGIINVTTVDPEYMDAYHNCTKAMQEAEAKMAKGEKVKMCGMCQAMGELMMSGAKVEHVPTERGHVMLITSDNPEMVAKIQAWGKRNQDEMEKMPPMPVQMNE